MSASLRGSKISDEATIDILTNFYDKYWEKHGERKKDDADTLLIIKREQNPLSPEKLTALRTKTTDRKLLMYIFKYGEVHYPDDYGRIGSRTTLAKSTKSRKTTSKGGKKIKRIYTRKTYRTKK
jgi:hypothetical protein